VLARLLVVVLVELADQLLEDRAHRVVVDTRRRQVDLGVEELADSVPIASAFDNVCSWFRNLKFSRMSWTFGEKPLR